MTLPLKLESDFVSDMVNTWGAGIEVVPVLAPGDFLLAQFEALASQLDFLQALVFQVLQLTRASTSVGPDLDTYFADFEFPRLAATFATGPVTLSSAQATAVAITVPAATLVNGVWTGGTLVQTLGGGIIFQVVPDPAQTAYQAVTNNYVLPAGGTSISVTVQALTAGPASNVVAGQIQQIGSQQSGISLVTNQSAIDNGAPAESDADYRTRFILYLATLARGTEQAIQAAAESVQQGLQISLAENQLPNGVAQLGTFTVFADNGSGAPPQALLNSIYQSVFDTRAFTVVPYVVGPSIFQTSVTVTIRVAAGFVLSSLQPQVQAAVNLYFEGLSAGQTAFVQGVNDAAMTVTGVVAVSPGTLINNVNLDYVPTVNQEVRVPAASVFVGSY